MGMCFVALFGGIPSRPPDHSTKNINMALVFTVYGAGVVGRGKGTVARHDLHTTRGEDE